MRTDITNALKKSYVALLKGHVSYEGKIVPVFDAYAVPDTAKRPYILLSSVSDTDSNTKDSFGYLAAMQVDVVTAFAKGEGGENDAGQIASMVCGLVQPTPTGSGLDVEGHDVITTSIDIRPFTNQSPTETIIRKILTITHLIRE